MHLGALLHVEGIPNLIAIGVPDQAALSRVLNRVKANQVRHYAWIEPDDNLGFTALATEPLDMERKKVFSNYRLYKDAGALEKSVGAFNGDSCTNTPVTQLQSAPL